MNQLQQVRSQLEKDLHKEEMLELSRLWGEARMKFVHHLGQTASKEDYFLNHDFYIVLVPTNERTPEGLPKDLPLVRRSCPTPGYNQNVWKYHHKTGNVEFLWSIPRKLIYWQLYVNRFKYLTDPVMKSRTAFVVSMESGKLLEWVKKENGELQDAVIKVNKQAEA
jgi:hypothetical protein